MELEDLIIQADEIKYETEEKKNTAPRVGVLFKNIIEFFKNLDDDLQEQINELDALFLAVNQNIDGGVANSNYTSTPTLNGGGA